MNTAKVVHLNRDELLAHRDELKAKLATWFEREPLERELEDIEWLLDGHK